MPSTVIEWLFWVFSVVIAGTVFSVLANLITPRVEKGGEGWLRKRRLRKEEYKVYMDQKAEEIEKHPIVFFLEYGAFFLVELSLFLAAVYLVAVEFNVETIRRLASWAGVVFIAAGGIINMWLIMRISDLRWAYKKMLLQRSIEEDIRTLERLEQEVGAQQRKE